nr:hypothetical protein BaRGS_021659 [Batillaria attramentaria]
MCDRAQFTGVAAASSGSARYKRIYLPLAAGDERANEHPALTLTHTIFMRLHNLIASEIMAIVTHNDADQVFRLARSVVEAIEQQITYGEWLPILLGPTVRSEFDLDLNKNIRYQMAVDPRIVSEFSTAAFRIGHTLIPRSFPLSSTRRVNLREIFFKPFEARENLRLPGRGHPDRY